MRFRMNDIGVCLILLSILSGCSRMSGTDPLTPYQSSGESIECPNEPGHSLLGIWSIDFNTTELTASITRVRSLQAHFNITNMVIPPACSDCLEIAVNSFDPVTRILDADVTLRNPTALSAYDVRGIMYTNDYGHKVLNADAWTKLFDIPGGEGINPFKAFAGTEPFRIFAGGASHTENYILYIPKPPHYAGITFAVDASLPGNCKEPYDITNFWQEQIDETPGASGNIYIDVFDWQNDVSKVSIVAPEITGQSFTQLSHYGGNTWSLNLVNNEGATAGVYKVRVIADSANSGAQPLYDFINITITSVIPPAGWARTWGSYSGGVAAGATDHTYVTGAVGTEDLDPGPGVDIHESNGWCDAFLSKFDLDGNYLWGRTWGGGDFDSGWAIAVDAGDKIYVAGSYHYQVDFDPGPGVDMHTANGSFTDPFLSKFDANGNHQWTRTWGNDHDESVVGVAVDNGQVYVTGNFQGTVDFDPGSGVENHNAGSGVGAYITKFNLSGDHLWTKSLIETELDSGAYGRAIAISGSSDIYVTGYFDGTIDFDPGTGVTERSSAGANSHRDAYLLKLDSGGTFNWVQVWGSDEDDLARDIAIDDSGGIYTSGYYSGSVDFYPGSGVDIHSSNGMYDAFISKFDTSGNFIWVQTWGGEEDDGARGMVISDASEVYVTGSFHNVVDLNPGSGTDEHISEGDTDAYLLKLNASGAYLWGISWGGEDSDYGSCMATDDYGDVYVLGRFSGLVDFYPGPGVDIHDGGFITIFLSKYTPDGNW